MDYSQLAVKYHNLVPNDYIFDILNVPEMNDNYPSIDNLKYNLAEADKPTSMLETEIIYDDNRLRTNPVRKALAIKPSRGLTLFNKYYDLAEAEDVTGLLKSRRDILTRLAEVESSFNSGSKNKNAPAYGYFQFMLGNYRGTNHNNIGKHAKMDINSFLNNPVALIHAANRLANEFMASFSKVELDKLHKLGWTDNAILAGCWLGGSGGVKRLAFRGIDSSDGSDSVAKRMMRFNY